MKIADPFLNPMSRKSKGGKKMSSGAPPSGKDFKSEIAFLYFWYHLDFLNDLVYAAALDFYAKPQVWKGVKNATLLDNFDKLRFQYGTEAGVPSAEQRAAIFG